MSDFIKNIDTPGLKIQETLCEVLLNKSDVVENKMIVTFTKEKQGKIENVEKINCRVFKFTPEWKIKEVIDIISSMVYSEFPNLFILIIENENFGFLKSSSIDDENLQQLKQLIEVSIKNRNFIVQLTSKSENISEFYYKSYDDEKIKHVSKDTTSLHEKYLNLYDIHENILNSKDLALICKFIGILEFSDDFLDKVIIECIKLGSKEMLIDILGTQIKNSTKVLTADAKLKMSKLLKTETEEEASILSVAVDNSKHEFCEFLINEYSICLNFLPFDHQVSISTKIFNNKNYNLLCELLNKCDFPFPDDFNPESINDENLQIIVSQRNNFHNLVKSGNHEQIKKLYNEKFSPKKIIFNAQNESALYQTVTTENIFIYHFLKANFGLRISETESIDRLLKFEFKKFIATDANILSSIPYKNAEVMTIMERTLIDIKNLNNDNHEKYFEKIQKLYEEIQITEIGSLLIKVTGSCKNLRIAFSFENYNVHNIDRLLELNTDLPHILYSQIFTIYINASNFLDENELSQMKDTLMDELFHYAFHIVFINRVQPYFRKNHEAQNEFEQIVKAYEKYNFDYSTDSKDHIKYNKNYCCIYKIQQILDQITTNFDKNEEVERLKTDVQNFYKKHIIPEFKDFSFQERKIVVDCNVKFKVLDGIKKLGHPKSDEYNIISKSQIELLNDVEVKIIKTNQPKLLLADIYQNHHPNGHDIFDTSSIVATNEQLNDKFLFGRLENAVKKSKKLTLFVDCSRTINFNKDLLNYQQNMHYVPIVTEEESFGKLYESFTTKNKDRMTVNYKWSNLTPDFQRRLLRNRPEFQGSTNLSLLDLLGCRNPAQIENIAENSSELIDDNVLKDLTEGNIIKINDKFSNREFNALFQMRKYTKNGKNGKNLPMTQDILLAMTKNDKIVLLKGSGLSWEMESIANELQRQQSNKWISIVDLKIFESNLKSQLAGRMKEEIHQIFNLDFSTFMVDFILMQMTEFEKKLFKKMYANGQISILFKGFNDSLKSDSVDIVSYLVESFKTNGGNQLWIGGEHNLIELQKRLNIDSFYKLEEFAQEDGIKFAKAFWMLKDPKKGKAEAEIRKSFQQFRNFEEKLKAFAWNVSDFGAHSLNFIMQHKMLAEIFIENINTEIELTDYEIYEKLLEKYYEYWQNSHGKNHLKVQQHGYFWKFHTFVGMEILTPKFSNLSEFDYDASTLTSTVMKQFRLIAECNRKFQFIHDKFANFLVARYLINNLKVDKINIDIAMLFKEIVINNELETTKKFINEALKQVADKEKVAENMSHCFSSDLLDLCEVFTQDIYDYENIGKFFNLILKSKFFAATENLKEFSLSNFSIIGNSIAIDQSQDGFNCIQKLLENIIKSSLDIEIFEKILLEINEQKPNFVKFLIKQSLDSADGFIQLISNSKFVDQEKLKKCQKILESYTDGEKIIIGANNFKLSESVRKEKIDDEKTYEHKFQMYLRELKIIHYQSSLQIKDKRTQRKLHHHENTNRLLSWEFKNLMLTHPVTKLLKKCLIFPSKEIHVDEQEEYHKKMKEWIEYIYNTKYGRLLLKLVSQFENLKIVFDFESEFIDNVDLTRNKSNHRDGTVGITHSLQDWVFIGAKNFNNEEQLKSVRATISHELCHYAVDKVFLNKTQPFFSRDKEAEALYEEILAEIIDKIKDTSDTDKLLDEKFDAIFLRIFFCYENDKLKQKKELIVRIPEMDTYYRDDKVRLNMLEKHYHRLVDFYLKKVNNEFELYNHERRQTVLYLNDHFGNLDSIKSKYEFEESRKILNFTQKVSIVTTNILNLYIFDVFSASPENVIIRAEYLNEKEIVREFKNILNQNLNLNIFIDCTKTTNFVSNWLLDENKTKFIFIVTNEFDRNSLIQNHNLHNAEKIVINYSWADLTSKNQKDLQSSEINFQGNKKNSVSELVLETNDDDFLKLSVDYPDYIINEKILEETDRDEEFDFLYRNRKIVRKQANEVDVPLTEEDSIIDENLDKKYVLLADKAGSGKSWFFKKIAKIFLERNKMKIDKKTKIACKKWVTYVDLKQHISMFKEFMKVIKSNEDRNFENNFKFDDFLVKNIIKLKFKPEEKIFQNMYEKGNVIIFFDGFDEIAPDCGDFVANLMKAFDPDSKGNQLWIATRDGFETQLKSLLEIENVYKLNDFSEVDGDDLIVASWVLNDLRKQEIHIKQKLNFAKEIRNHPNLVSYRKLARELTRKGSRSTFNVISNVLLYKILADIFKNDKESIKELTEYEIYGKFVSEHYVIWSEKKGIIRSEAESKFQKLNLSFSKFHQLQAIEYLAPKFKDLFRIFDKNEWPDEEIIACGLLTKIDKKFYFIHETFAEYFVADFLIEMMMSCLKTEKYINEVFKFLSRIIVGNYYAVRLFLDGGLAQDSVKDKIEDIAYKFANVNLNENFKDFHEILSIKFKYQPNLEKFFVLILQNNEYKNITDDLFRKFQDNFKSFKNLREESKPDAEDLKDAFVYLMDVLKSGVNIINFKGMVYKIKEVYGEVLMQTILKQKLKYDHRNIYHVICESEKIDSEKFKECMKFLKQILPGHELEKMMRHTNYYNENIIHVCTQSNDKEKLKYAWNQVSNAKEYVMNKTSGTNEVNILQLFAAESIKSDFRETFWDLLVRLFDDQEELKKFIMSTDSFDFNFLHELIHNGQADILDSTLKLMKEKLNSKHFNEILHIKYECNQNLLLYAARRTKNVQTHEVLWKYIGESCTSEEFKEFWTELDSDGNNILALTIIESSEGVLNFIIKQLEIHTSRKDIRYALGNSNEFNYNLLQIAAHSNQSLQMHEYLWEIFNEYFDQSEILKMVKHCDKDGKNSLIFAILHNTQDVASITWEKIKETLVENKPILMKKHDYYLNTIGKIVRYFKYFEHNFGNITPDINEIRKIDDKAKEYLMLIKIDVKAFEIFKLSEKEFVEYIEDHVLFQTSSEYEGLAHCPDEEIRRTAWRTLLKYLKNDENWKSFLAYRNYDGDSYIHMMIKNNDEKIIRFELENLNSNFEIEKIQQILRSNGSRNRNLLQTAACFVKNIDIFMEIWAFVKCHCKEEIAIMIDYIDSNKNNLILNAARWGSRDVLDFLFTEYENVKNEKITENFLQFYNNYGENILHLCGQSDDGDKFEFLWHKLENISNNFKEFIQTKTVNLSKETFMHLTRDCINENFHRIIWKLITKIFVDSDEMINFVSEKNVLNQSFIHLYLKADKYSEIEIIFDELKSKLHSTNFEKFLNIKYDNSHDFLNFAVIFSKNTKTHEVVWKIYLEHFGSSNMTTIITSLKQNLLYLAIRNNTKEIMAYTWAKIESYIFTKEERIKYLEPVSNDLKSIFSKKSLSSEARTWIEDLLKSYDLKYTIEVETFDLEWN